MYKKNLSSTIDNVWVIVILVLIEPVENQFNRRRVLQVLLF